MTTMTSASLDLRGRSSTAFIARETLRQLTKTDLAFGDVTITGYLTFMETMARAGINVFLQYPLLPAPAGR